MEAMASSDFSLYLTAGVEIFYNICLVFSFCFTQSENIGSEEVLHS